MKGAYVVLVATGWFGASILCWQLRGAAAELMYRARHAYTLGDRLAQYGPAARARLVPPFKAAGVAYPPREVVLVGLKREETLEVWASDGTGPESLIRKYPILAASGGPGPKLRRGDRQVPEGLYRVEFLNPNSRYHLSLRLNYPNAFDRQRARQDGRDDPGSDIMIHGKDVSAGCLAIGDEAVEDIFVLAADTGIANIDVILAPFDFRRRDLGAAPGQPAWVGEFYERLRKRLAPFRPGDA